MSDELELPLIDPNKVTTEPMYKAELEAANKHITEQERLSEKSWNKQYPWSDSDVTNALDRAREIAHTTHHTSVSIERACEKLEAVYNLVFRPIRNTARAVAERITKLEEENVELEDKIWRHCDEFLFRRMMDEAVEINKEQAARIVELEEELHVERQEYRE